MSDGELWGQTDRENEVSIGRSRAGGKHFSRSAVLGFYASGHDGKMTEKWDLHAPVRKTRSVGSRGQGGEKRCLSGFGVSDSRNELSALADSRRPRRRSLGLPKAVNWSALVKPGRDRHDLAVETIETMVGARLTGIARILAAVEPFDAGFSAGPADERVNTGRQSETA